MEQPSKLEQQVGCIACPWNRHCIEPPTMSKEDVKAEIEKAKDATPGSEEGREVSVLGGVLAIMVYGGKDQEAHVCPIFANALKSGPELTQKIKGIMQGR